MADYVKWEFPCNDLVDLAFGVPPEGYEIVEREIVAHERWSVVTCLVFSYEGKFYETTFSRGATEIQNESPYQHDGDLVECIEVFPEEATVTRYNPAAKEGTDG